MDDVDDMLGGDADDPFNDASVLNVNASQSEEHLLLSGGAIGSSGAASAAFDGDADLEGGGGDAPPPALGGYCSVLSVAYYAREKPRNEC